MDSITRQMCQHLTTCYNLERLQQVDWLALAEYFEPKVVCCECGAEEAEDCTDSWFQHEGQWYCEECREEKQEGWATCDGCSEFFPSSLLTYYGLTLKGAGLYCSQCEKSVVVKLGDILVDQATRREYYKVVAYDHVHYQVIWYKWGYVPDKYLNLFNVEHALVPRGLVSRPTTREMEIFNKQKRKAED